MSQICDFECVTVTPGMFRLICRRCGARRWSRTEKYVRLCDKQPAVEPETPRERWIRAGRPVRTQQEQDRIVATHCEGCKHFQRKKRACRLCCKEYLHRVRLPGRLRMATESCPAKPAKWRAET